MPLRSIAAALLAASLAQAQPADKAPPHNGALDYWRAGTLASNKVHAAADESAISKLPWDKVGETLDPAKMPPEFETARKEIEPEAVIQFIRAGEAPVCDFQPHFEDGWKMLLPELAVVRHLARMARVDARARLMEGDAPGAAERVVAMYRAAGNTAGEHVLISSLVGAAIGHTANDEAKVLAASGKLADADRQRLLAAIRALKNDGYRVRAALEGERRVTSGWLKKEFAGPGAPARFVQEFADMSPEVPAEQRQRTAALAKLSPEEFAAAASKMDGYYADMLKAWDSPTAKDEIKALDNKVDKGAYGLVAQVLAPAMSNARRSYDKAMAELASAEEALTKKP